MKKGIIAITVLLTGALLITPITTNASSAKNDSQPVKFEQVNNNENTEHLTDIKENQDETAQNETIKDDIKVNVENTYKPETNNNQSVKVETEEEVAKEEVAKEEVAKEETTNEPVIEEVQPSKMSKSDAEAVLNKYLNDTQQSEITYTYKGDENTFEAMQQKGIRGYVFLPNAETDMAYLVDSDNGNIYYFHSSGYFELI